MQEITYADILQYYRKETEILLEEQKSFRNNMHNILIHNSEIWSGNASRTMEEKLRELLQENNILYSGLEEVQQSLTDLGTALLNAQENDL